MPPGSPRSLWSSGVASSSALERTLQQRISQEAVPNIEHLPFQARGGESVRFHYQMGQWCAEVSFRIGPFSRRAVLPVVCSQGTDIASSLEILSRDSSWYSQRQIHILPIPDQNMLAKLREVLYLGDLGLKGGGQTQSSGRGGKALSNRRKQEDGEELPEQNKKPFNSKHTALSTSALFQSPPSTSKAVISSAVHPTTNTVTSLKTASSVKGKEQWVTTEPYVSGLSPAHIDQSAEQDPIEADRQLKDDIDELSQQLSKAGPESYLQIVNNLIVNLTCLVDLEKQIGAQGRNNAQYYSTALLKKVHATRPRGRGYELVNIQLRALQKRAYIQEAANSNLGGKTKTWTIRQMLQSWYNTLILAEQDTLGSQEVAAYGEC